MGNVGSGDFGASPGDNSQDFLTWAASILTRLFKNPVSCWSPKIPPVQH